MLKDTSSINKPRFIMCEKFDREELIKALKLYRSGWANDIREGWQIGNSKAMEILYSLYSICGNIILALEDTNTLGRCKDKMAMVMSRKKLEDLVKSPTFTTYDALGEIHACNVVTTGTKHHIRVMFETLEELTK